MIHVADAQCRQLRLGNAGDSATWHPDIQILKRLAISRDDLASCQGEMEVAVKNAQGLLEMAS